MPAVKGVARREVSKLSGGALSAPAEDDVVAEEPLEIRVAGETLAITMRTPGADRELAVGSLSASPSQCAPLPPPRVRVAIVFLRPPPSRRHVDGVAVPLLARPRGEGR